jgi:hypothetical protein
MNRLLRGCLPALFAGLIPILGAVAQSAPAPPSGAAPAGGAQPGGGPPGGQMGGPPKNLKVLPKNISNADLRKLMRQFAGDLGVECEFCHAMNPQTKRPDFPSDAKPEKETARYMIQMTDDLNNKYLAEMPDRRYADPIDCGTCHRGEKHPSIFVPAPRQEGNRPPGGPAADVNKAP